MIRIITIWMIRMNDPRENDPRGLGDLGRLRGMILGTLGRMIRIRIIRIKIIRMIRNRISL